MIALDKGRSLRTLLDRVETQSGRRCTLYVAVPFIEVESHSWRATLAAAQAGARVCVITRSPSSSDIADQFRNLERLGGRTVIVENLHAKAIMWFGTSRRDRAAFVGSSNFTRSSESYSVELGIYVAGDGLAENLFYRDLKSFVEDLVFPHRPSRVYSHRACRRLQHRGT
jgi:phosphatidylserine/phosphatidylglycerophosphate/cardiolipin synthase-like enzyme